MELGDHLKGLYRILRGRSTYNYKPNDRLQSALEQRPAAHRCRASLAHSRVKVDMRQRTGDKGTLQGQGRRSRRAHSTRAGSVWTSAESGKKASLVRCGSWQIG